jgi:ABC-2 type transport system permease protein
MKKYLKVYRVFLNNSISYISQYRKDTWIKIFLNVLWLLTIFITIEVIFGQTKEILGWNKEEVYLLTVVWIIVDETYLFLFGASLEKIPDLITRGDLDFYLIKPINTLFLASTKLILVRSVYRLAIEFIILAWLIWQFDFALSFLHMFLALILAIVGIMVNYSMFLIANTLSFWFYRIENINYLIESVSDFGRFPISILPRTIKIIILTIIPIAFQAYIPVATLTGRWPWYLILYAFIFAIILFIVAGKFWSFAIKRYSSASS